jgi:hypothetical protein
MAEKSDAAAKRAIIKLEAWFAKLKKDEQAVIAELVQDAVLKATEGGGQVAGRRAGEVAVPPYLRQLNTTLAPQIVKRIRFGEDKAYEPMPVPA